MKRQPRGPRKPENVDAGRAIAARRRAAGLTQVELAERAGINRETMWRIEQGKQYPRPRTLDKLAAVFGVTRIQTILSHNEILTMIQAQIVRAPFYCRLCNQSFTTAQDRFMEITLPETPYMKLCIPCARAMCECMSTVLDSPTVTLAASHKAAT